MSNYSNTIAEAFRKWIELKELFNHDYKIDNEITDDTFNVDMSEYDLVFKLTTKKLIIYLVNKDTNINLNNVYNLAVFLLEYDYKYEELEPYIFVWLNYFKIDKNNYLMQPTLFSVNSDVFDSYIHKIYKDNELLNTVNENL